MPLHTQTPRLADIIESAERLRGLLEGINLESFESDWQRQWLVERGLDIISEVSRHLTPGLKDRHQKIPWKKVAGTANSLRHDYGNTAAPIVWALVKENLSELETWCREELAAGDNESA
jgi:uncharacterized protein with HEPN domain